jgi:hypothetical protein
MISEEKAPKFRLSAVMAADQGCSAIPAVRSPKKMKSTCSRNGVLPIVSMYMFADARKTVKRLRLAMTVNRPIESPMTVEMVPSHSCQRAATHQLIPIWNERGEVEAISQTRC